MNTNELFKRQKIAEEVANKLFKKAKQRAKESDEKSSHLPSETRAIVKVYNGLLLWCCEGYPDEILWFYQHGSIPCWQRISMFDRDVNTMIVLLKDKGKAALAADVEGRWQNIKQAARKIDEKLSGLSERYNHDEDNPAYANDVKSALFDIKTYASQLGESLFEVAKQQASEAKTQLEQKSAEKGLNTTPTTDWWLWSCVKRIPRWIYVLVIFLAALLTIFHLLGWLEPIKTFIYKLLLSK